MVQQIQMETSQTNTASATVTATVTATAIKAKANTKNKRQPRPRPLPPAVTSRNLAIEKRRRQDMNRVFLDLARCVPPLASSKRLSKILIVRESLHHLRRQRDMCVAAGRELRELLYAHNTLIAEVNTLRSQLQIPVKNPPRPPSAAFLSLMNVEYQTYGEFPNGFASPSVTENDQPQPSTRHEEVNTSLFELPTVPHLLSPVQTSAQDCLLDNYLDGARDIVPPETWQAQTPGHFSSSSNAQGALISDTDWWGLNISGMNSEVVWEGLPAPILPWEEACNDVPQDCSEGAPVPF